MLCALVLVLASSAQDAALEAGRRALAAGEREEAYRHGLVALESEPRSIDALALLLEAASGDADAHALWAHELAAVAGDAQGKLALERRLAALLPSKDTSIAAIAQARAAAAGELASYVAALSKGADKHPENVPVVGWARALGRELVHAAPVLATEHSAAFAPGFPLLETLRKPVLDALDAELDRARATGRTGDVIEIARVLRGLSSQARFDDLEGPQAPELTALEREATQALDDARRKLADEQAAPQSIEQLELMDGAERDLFTREHASWANPGVALSPRAWYRVETTCGHATLLGVAETVELHHQRLANWYGSDPFVDRPGVLRVAPEASDLESEGTPFWWAGGFQSGDLTVLRFACGTIEGFGHGLTHELTHRFDGALCPGIPAWLAEGKAVWTAAAYANSDDEQFVEGHASFGTIEDASIRGYGAREKLEKLVAGTIEDYRDNYVAGYALYVYLRTWGDEGAAPRYAARLDEFMRSRARDKRAPLAAFAAHFADGEDGRPADMQAFADDFGRWAGGFYWRDRQPWTARYTESAGAARASEHVLDEPTWVWSRSRAEPWFGQDQARAAGDLLLRLGNESGALRAWAWSLGVDEHDDDTARALADLCEELDLRDAAWVVRRDSSPPASAAPMLARLPKTRALLDLLGDVAAGYAERGSAHAGAALAADHDRVAAQVGRALLAPGWPALAVGPSLHPFDEPRRSLMAAGWREDGLTDYERHRVEGLWCVDERGHLHVGRAKPRAGTGSADREAHQHDAFVRSDVWLEPGRYSVKARITPTTSYVAGSIVLGFTRRDRNLRFSFSAGDFLYAIGDKEAAAELDHVDWRISGLRERDGGLPGAAPSGQFGFPKAVSSFEVELSVDQGALAVQIDGELVGVYHTADGTPIEGALGFAVSFGDIKVASAGVQRLDRSAACGLDQAPPAAFDLARARSAGFRELVGRRVVGLPRARAGSVCLWLSITELEPDGGFDRERTAERMLARARDFEVACLRHDFAARLVIALPAALGATLESVKASICAALPDLAARLEFVAYGPASPAELAAATERFGLTDTHQHWLCFVDAAGVLRVAESFHTGKALEAGVRRWIEVFRLR